MYQIINGPADAPKVECLSPQNQCPWAARFCYKTDEDGNTTYAMSKFSHRPSVDDVRVEVASYFNDIVKERILSGWTYENVGIWLSNENQMNYATAAAVGAESLVIKGGSEEAPQYLTLSSAEDIRTFVTAMRDYIANTVAWGWEQKDNFDYSPYE